MLANILRIAKMQLKEYTYYKLNSVLEALNAVIEITVYIFIWIAIYGQENVANAMSIEQMSTYYILSISLALIVEWGIDGQIGDSIRKGQVNRQLLNPISYFQYYFGVKIGETAYLGIVGLATFIICSSIFGVILPTSIFNFMSFIVMILLNCLILFFIDIIIGMCAFYTTMIWGMTVFRKAIITIFSGLIAPITLFPAWFQNISKILPFQEFIYTPVSIYMGMLNNQDILITFGKQILWIIILYVIAKKFYNKAIKNITINGG